MTKYKRQYSTLEKIEYYENRIMQASERLEELYKELELKTEKRNKWEHLLAPLKNIPQADNTHTRKSRARRGA